jgi:ceramide glucosyltransferase
MFYAPEILSGAFIPFATTAVLALALNVSWIAAVLTVATVWYGAEAKLARVASWPLTWAYPFYALVRDLTLPALWVTGWLGSDFVWRGNAVSSVSAGEEPASETPPI